MVVILFIIKELCRGSEVEPKPVNYVLHKRRRGRRVALRKSPSSEGNKALRLEWAREHVH